MPFTHNFYNFLKIITEMEKKIILQLEITVCFTDLDQGSKVNIFEAILTTFMAMIVFGGHWGNRGSSKNWFELRIES